LLNVTAFVVVPPPPAATVSQPNDDPDHFRYVLAVVGASIKPVVFALV